MSAGGTLLIFLGGNGVVDGWLRFSGGHVAARGPGLDGLVLSDPETGEPLRIVAAVPGDKVSLHWLELPSGLAPAQALAAARLIAADISAEPLADMHVAIGPEVEGSPLRCVALVRATAMMEWLIALQTHGLDPDVVIPEPLLLVPQGESIIRYDRAGLPLYRGVTEAFSLEPDLAETIFAGREVAAIDDAAFEAGLAEALVHPSLDLRQGPFAKRRRWTIEWPLVRRLALQAAAILLVTLAIQVTAVLHYTFAADAAERELAAVATHAVPESGSADPAAALDRRLADLRGGGAGFVATASALFDAVRATPNVELSALRFERDGTLTATAQADSVAGLAALRQRIEAEGFSVETGAPRTGGGRQIADLTVRAP